MDSKANISNEVTALHNEGAHIAQSFQKDENQNFRYEYQRWYTRALRVVNVLAPDRYAEFKSFYEIDPKRKTLGYGTYVIQDYLRNVAPNRQTHPDFSVHEQVVLCFLNQLTIFRSLLDRTDSVLASIDGQLLSELQDAELETARQLININIRASGSLSGVVIENHLQKVAKNHGITIRKKNPTISDLNDPLKNEGVLDTPTWRKIAYLADIRNICSHKKDVEPTK